MLFNSMSVHITISKLLFAQRQGGLLPVLFQVAHTVEHKLTSDLHQL